MRNTKTNNMENINGIKYLIKFVTQEEHAQMLYDGKLYTHCIKYYHSISQQGQGDIREASLFPNFRIYRGTDYPIYCLMAVKTDDIKDKTVLINKKAISDFNCQEGFIVIIDYITFCERLKSLNYDSKSVKCYHRLVTYGTPTQELSLEWFCDLNSLDHIFVKGPSYKHQQEYRILISDSIDYRSVIEFHDGEFLRARYYDVLKVYQLDKDLHDISEIYSIKELSTDKDHLLIRL